MKINYSDGTIITKNLSSRFERILSGVYSLELNYLSRVSYNNLPFTLLVYYNPNSPNSYIGLFISVGIIMLICVFCSFCFYKCSKKIVENANRRFEERNIIQLPNLLDLNNLHSQENMIRETNMETLEKLLENDLKSRKYSEGLNIFHTNCTICLEEFNPSSEVIFLFCKHIFHLNCLKDWLIRNILLPKCPNCNYNVLTGGVIDMNILNLNSNNNNNLDNNNIRNNSNNNNYINNQVLFSNNNSQQQQIRINNSNIINLANNNDIINIERSNTVINKNQQNCINISELNTYKNYIDDNNNNNYNNVNNINNKENDNNNLKSEEVININEKIDNNNNIDINNNQNENSFLNEIKENEKFHQENIGYINDNERNNN